MEKRVPVKTMYLLLVIVAGLVVLGIGSTYAVFTATAEISSPIVLSSNLSYQGNLIETVSVEVPAKGYARTTLNIVNTTNNTLNYTAWYIKGYDIEVGTESGAPTGSLLPANTTSVVVEVRNNQTENVTVIFGISSNVGSVVLGNGMKVISNKKLPDMVLEGAASYITNLYLTSNPTMITQENSGNQYYYAASASLMSDGLQKSGNIRYYGANPDNYIYFNCSDYLNQNDNTCEKWRIIGVFDGKLKIIRDDILGKFAWDYTSDGEYDNNWHDSTLMSLLNDGYYNNSDNVTSYYYGSKTITSNFKSENIGIKNDITRELIADGTWYLGNGKSASTDLNTIYANERGDIIRSNTEKTWTGKIAIMYPSDYGYAADLSLCDYNLASYNNAACTGNNWLYNGDEEWFISPSTSTNSSYMKTNVWSTNSSGSVSSNLYPRGARPARPTLYLNSNVSIIEGDGTSDSPYKLYAESLASDYIKSLYLNSSPTMIRQENETNLSYYYAKSVNLMSDGLDNIGNKVEGMANGNIRYYGANPNNYVYFNCYEYPDTNCEKWRIVGVFDGKLKLVRSSALGSFAWDYNTAYQYDNNWHNSTLNTLLNNGYFNNSNNVTSYYYDSKTMTSNFKSEGVGIKNGVTRDLIANSTWYLGNGGSAGQDLESIYYNERAEDAKIGANTRKTWTGKIALLYPSDYGYATDLSLCDYYLDDYNNSECINNNWLYTGVNTWLISPSTSSSSSYVNTNVWSVQAAGNVGGNVLPRGKRSVLPTLYLNADIRFTGKGDGTLDNPYRLSFK